MRRLKTGRRPPIYPKTPGHLPCSSLTHPLPLPSRRPSVSFGGFGPKATAYERATDPVTSPRNPKTTASIFANDNTPIRLTVSSKPQLRFTSKTFCLSKSVTGTLATGRRSAKPFPPPRTGNPVACNFSPSRPSPNSWNTQEPLGYAVEEEYPCRDSNRSANPSLSARCHRRIVSRLMPTAVEAVLIVPHFLVLSQEARLGVVDAQIRGAQGSPV